MFVVEATQSVVICFSSLSRLVQSPKMKNGRDGKQRLLGEFVLEEGFLIRKRCIGGGFLGTGTTLFLVLCGRYVVEHFTTVC